MLKSVLAAAVYMAMLIAIVGFFRRARYRSCLLLVAYLGVALVGDVMMDVWPHRFYNRPFWFAKELIANAMLLGVAFELGLRIFRAFPGARSTARFLVVLSMIATAFSVLPVWPGDGQLTAAAIPLQTRFLNGSVWLFSALAAVILWYRLPIDGLQKALFVGLVPYLLAVTAGLNFLESATTPETWASIRPSVANAMAAAYLFLVSYWAYVIWKPASETIQAAERSRTANNATLPL